MKKACKKGATLGEMAIVLAVLAVISLVVVSFIVALNSRVKLSKAKLAAMQDIQAIEAIVERRIAEEYANGNSPDFKIENGALVSGEETLYAHNATVTKIECAVEKTEKDAIFFVTLTYKLPNAEENYIFCVNPYAGDILGGAQ